MKSRLPLIIAGALALALVVYLLVRGGSDPKVASKSSVIGKTPNSQAKSPATGPNSTKPASLRGSVAAADGTPLAGATIALVATDASQAALAVHDAILLCGDDGGFAYPSLPPGAYTISANAPGYLPKQISLALKAGQDHRDLLVQLEPGGFILSGTVHDATGGPISSAVVQAVPIGGNAERASGASCDEGGEYQLSLANGQYMVWAFHADYVPHLELIEVSGGPLTLDFRLAPGAVVEGQVKHLGSNDPLAGATVAYATERSSAFGLWAGASGAGTTIADSDGRFRIAGLGSGALRLTATGDNARTAEPTHIPLGIAEHRSDIELFVESAYRIRGRVVDANSGEGVGEMLVTLASSDGTSSSEDARTGPDGTFEIRSVANGDYRLRAKGKHYLRDMFGVAIAVDGDTNAGDILVTQGDMIHGRVEPASEADISLDLRALADMPMEAFATTRSAADGIFEIGPFRPGSFRLQARTDDGRIGTTNADVPAAGSNEIVIHLESGGSIEGKVVDADGSPVANAQVSLRQDSKGRSVRVVVNGVDRMAQSGRTSPNGAFLIQGLSGGDYQLLVLDPEGQPFAWAGGGKASSKATAKMKPKTLHLGAKENRTGEVLTVELRDAKISGRVVGPDGRPAADTWVSARLHRDDASPGDAPPSDAQPPGDAKNTSDAHSEVSMIMVEDGDGGAGGAPGLDLNRSGELAPVLTDAEGAFEITGLREGEYDLIAEGMKGAARAIVKGARTGQEIEIRLKALTRIEGVVTQRGEPVTRYRIELSGTGHVRKQIRDEGGSFAIQRLDPGPYTVRVRGPEGEAEASVTVVAGKTTQVEIALESLVRVTGVIVDESGAPVEGVLTIPTPMQDDGNIQLDIGDDVSPTGADGKFRVDVKPGSYLLMVLKIGAGPMATIPFVATDSAAVDLGSIVAKPGAEGPGEEGAPNDEEEN